MISLPTWLASSGFGTKVVLCVVSNWPLRYSSIFFLCSFSKSSVICFKNYIKLFLPALRWAWFSCLGSRRYQLCFCFCHSCINRIILIVFSGPKRVVRIPENSVLGIVNVDSRLKPFTMQKVVMLFGEVSLSKCTAIALLFTVHAFFVPVGHESAWVAKEVPLASLGVLVIGVHLGGVVREHCYCASKL